MSGYSTIEGEIQKHGKGVFTNVGDSMMPLLRQRRDIIHISKVTGRLKKYDVPLYKRDNGQYVLHRILKVRDNDYLICGDNRTGIESGITDRHIIGVMTGVSRDGKFWSVDDKKYRLYVLLWGGRRSYRILFLRIKGIVRKIFRANNTGKNNGKSDGSSGRGD